MSRDACVSLDMLMTGRRLKGMIVKKGFSVKDIQRKLNLSCPQPVYRWLNGQTLPSLDNLYMLSNVLGMPMEDLLMPRNDRMWLVYIPEDKDWKRRLQRYYGVMNRYGRGT